MISKNAIVEDATIGKNVTIGEFAIIRKGAIIGDNVIIHPFVSIEEGVVIGSNVEIFNHAFLGKAPKGPGMARVPVYEKKVVIGDYCVLGPNTVIYYSVNIGNNCLIGDGVSIRENCYLGTDCVIGRNSTINFGTVLGNKTRLGDLVHLTGNVEVGDNVFIGPGVVSADDNSMGRAADYDGLHDKGATIKDGVSIGEACVLLPRVVIGENSVIGAGTIVRKNIPENSLVMDIQKSIKVKNQ